jgi:3'-5' exonuclease
VSHVDLCDLLSSFNPQCKAALHELCRAMGMLNKLDGISGADVERYYRERNIREIAEYCESDVVNTYRVWLRHELFRGRQLCAGIRGE